MTQTMLLPVATTYDDRPSLVRRTLLDSAYSFTALLLAVPAFSLVVAGLAAGLGTLVVAGLGLAILLGTAYVARGFASVERIRLRSMHGVATPFPRYNRAEPEDGRVRQLLTPLRDVQSWLDILWCLLSLATGVFAFVLTVSWWATAGGGLTYWFWQRYIPYDPQDNVTLSGLIGLGEGRDAESVLLLGIGVVALLTLPLAVRLAAAAAASVSRVLLCSRVEMVERLAESEGRRESAHRAEAASLRKLERDIHDGPQQRLIRLGMDLGRARSQVHEDPDRAAATLDAALDQARDAVEELRALSRGIAPPLLVDRGLAVALREMSDGQSFPVRLNASLPPRMDEALETVAYFVVSEALTNVAKHGGATQASVDVVVAGGWLTVVVEDDGRGGARVEPGHGLAGLQERLAGVGGALQVISPEGGPTRVIAEVPLT